MDNQSYGFSGFGGPEQQLFISRRAPEPGRGEVLVRVAATSVNPLDYLLRSGLSRDINGHLPFPQVLGVEASGRVLAVGSDVEGLSVGQDVFGLALGGAGTYARTTLLTAAMTAPKPPGLRHDWAATIPVAAASAFDAVEQLDLAEGATVVVNGAGGGVGTFAAQIARSRGLIVIGIGSTAKQDVIGATGASAVDYAAGDLTERIATLAPDGVEGIIDLVGGASLRALAALVPQPSAAKTRIVSVGDATVVELGGESVRRRLNRETFGAVATLMVTGRLTPFISATLPLDRAAEALALVEAGHAAGKVVIDVEGLSPTSTA